MSEYRYKLPDVGEGVVEAEIVEWRVKAGDTVVEDQPVLDVMTDKATVEVPCAVNGVVTKTVGEPGDVIAVGTEILFIDTSGADAPSGDPDEKEAEPKAEESPAEAAPAEAPKEEAKEEPKPEPKAEEKPAPGPTPAARPVALAPVPSGGKPLASPAVRQRARENDVDLSAVPGSGPAGRVTHQDLDDFIASGGRLAARAGSTSGPFRAPKTGVEEKKIIGLRRKIAENMQKAKRDIPHIAYVEEIDVTALEDLRAHLNATKRDDQPKLTFIPFLAAALVKALPETPQANAHYDGEAGVLKTYEGVHLGIAAATPNGLMVPVIRHAEALDVWEIAAELGRLAKAARDGKATKDELSGSTITITSLGAIGGLVTTPVINQPETAIIGVNKMMEVPRFDGGGRVVPKKVMNLSSSFDHRIVDGYDAALLIQRVKGYLENPATLFMY
ncbi:dihydrolipoamide acetyltransferase family protein [Hyphobacterium marinum]|uniref:Dihydrolipoamide acetyltransferase component of pyruvate dehydrogenase complex n=1 Tax=Hyphobacterium marinum TaxID=3116574 RepID=A0ABU7LX93_9PROT|nr:dihydrolipoamide acetyltransferase family protein [Hyphobacterium sp. Y6023]MEE2566182.1 dihydrolipoamide acetyltransferase family protein [Hyphobacterium sp. Y6023]